MLGVRAGRFRMPFGIYSRSDHGYSGFLRPPLIRYDGYFGVSNNWLEDGAMFTAGVPQLFVEASVSRPHDVGFAIRREGLDASIRVAGLPRTVRRRRELRAQQSVPVRRDLPSDGRRFRVSTCDGRIRRSSGARRVPEGALVRRGLDDGLVRRRHRPPPGHGAVHGGRPR